MVNKAKQTLKRLVHNKKEHVVGVYFTIYENVVESKYLDHTLNQSYIEFDGNGFLPISYTAKGQSGSFYLSKVFKFGANALF